MMVTVRRLNITDTETAATTIVTLLLLLMSGLSVINLLGAMLR